MILNYAKCSDLLKVRNSSKTYNEYREKCGIASNLVKYVCLLRSIDYEPATGELRIAFNRYRSNLTGMTFK